MTIAASSRLRAACWGLCVCECAERDVARGHQRWWASRIPPPSRWWKICWGRWPIPSLAVLCTEFGSEFIISPPHIRGTKRSTCQRSPVMSPHLRGVAIRSLVFVSHNLMYAEPTKARGLSVKWSKNKLTIKSDDVLLFLALLIRLYFCFYRIVTRLINCWRF